MILASCVVGSETSCPVATAEVDADFSPSRATEPGDVVPALRAVTARLGTTPDLAPAKATTWKVDAPGMSGAAPAAALEARSCVAEDEAVRLVAFDAVPGAGASDPEATALPSGAAGAGTTKASPPALTDDAFADISGAAGEAVCSLGRNLEAGGSPSREDGEDEESPCSGVWSEACAARPRVVPADASLGKGPLLPGVAGAEDEGAFASEGDALPPLAIDAVVPEAVSLATVGGGPEAPKTGATLKSRALLEGKEGASGVEGCQVSPGQVSPGQASLGVAATGTAIAVLREAPLPMPP
jgi:hypothetical protein